MSAETTRLHKALGVVTFIAWLAMLAISMLPNYALSRSASILLVVTFLTFLGFGQLVSRFFGFNGGGGR